MAEQERLVVFCYDVTDNRSRRHISKIMMDQAVRIQRSVFEARMTWSHAKSIAREAEVWLGAGDSLKLYSLPLSGQDKCMSFGSTTNLEDGDFFLF